MSTINLDGDLTSPLSHSTPVRSVSDVANLINSSTRKNSYARWIVSLNAIIPIIFLLVIRFEPTRQDIDSQPEIGGHHV
jgi:hypothetical protein